MAADKEIGFKLTFKNLTKGEIDEVRRGLAGMGDQVSNVKEKGDALKFAFAGWANEALKFAKDGLLAIASASVQVAEGLAKIALDHVQLRGGQCTNPRDDHVLLDRSDDAGDDRR